jgi:hypothetical protein
MITTLLLISTWPFWLLLFIFLGFELYLIEKEQAWETTLSLTIFIALVLLFTDWKPWHTITIGEIIGYGLAYLFIGVLYAFPRWMVYVKDAAKAFEGRYSNLKRGWESRNVAEGSAWNSAWSRYSTFEELLRAEYKMPPMPWDYGVKSKIYMWMGYWPLSASWLLIHRPFEWFFDWAYATIKQTLEQLSYKIFKSHFEGK